MAVDRESPIQISIVDFLRTVLPDAIVHHCKGEINRSGATFMREQAKANRKGAMKGFPDLVVLPWSNIGPLFLEVKAPGNYADKTQKAFHARLEALGYRVAVVRSIDDVRASLQRWGIATKEAGSLVDLPLRGVVR